MMGIDIDWIEKQVFQRPLTADERQAITAATQEVAFAKGSELIVEDQPCNALYLLYQGSANALHNSHGENVRVGEIEAGAPLGDMAIFNGAPYSVTVTARSDCAVYAISRRDLERIMEQFPQLAVDLMRNTIRRLSGIVRSMNSVNAYSQQFIHGRRV